MQATAKDHHRPQTCFEGVAYVWYHIGAIDTGQEGRLNILEDERGLVFGLVMLVLTVLFLIAALVALIMHSLIVFLILLGISFTVYPVTASLKKRFA